MEDQQRKDLSKKQIKNFLLGCENKKCLSQDCKNYIIKNPELQILRENQSKAFQYALNKLKEQNLKVECAYPPKVLNLNEQAKQFEIIFKFDFQTYLNMSEEEQHNTCQKIGESFLYIEDNVQNQDEIYKLIDSVQSENFKKMKQILEQNSYSIELISLLSSFLICFRNVFQISCFKNFQNMIDMLQYLDFSKLFKNEMKNQVLLGINIEKSKHEELVENIQNMITYTKLFNEKILNFKDNECQLIKASCQVLEFFFYLNEIIDHQNQIPVESFKNDEILTKEEQHLEILRLIIKTYKKQGKEIPIQLNTQIKIPEYFNFLNWEFFFTVAEKVDLLRFETKVLQQFEINSQLNNLLSNPLQLLQGGLYLELSLRRDHILEDALNQLHIKGKGTNLQKPLRIKFQGEPGLDEGGLTKEFFQILIDRLFDANFGMFKKKSERYLWFNHDSFECNLNFELIGMLLGLALYNSTILKLDFPKIVYKKIKQTQGSTYVKDQLTIQDLEEIDPDLYYSLYNLLNTDLSKSDIGMTYQISYESWGEEKDYDLIPNGSEISVDNSNKKDFVDKYVDWYLNLSIKNQFDSFSKGFNKVTLSGQLIHMFTSEDLFLAINGAEHLDFNELKKTTKYDDGYDDTSKTIQFFWKILIEDFDDYQQKNFLKFLTGSDRSPLRGLSDIKMTLSRHGKQDQLPSAHTCFNHLLLPDYQDYEILKEKLTKAIENFEGFGLF